jgi:hypothetical protein
MPLTSVQRRYGCDLEPTVSTRMWPGRFKLITLIESDGLLSHRSERRVSTPGGTNWNDNRVRHGKNTSRGECRIKSHKPIDARPLDMKRIFVMSPTVDVKSTVISRPSVGEQAGHDGRDGQPAAGRNVTFADWSRCVMVRVSSRCDLSRGAPLRRGMKETDWMQKGCSQSRDVSTTDINSIVDSDI